MNSWQRGNVILVIRNVVVFPRITYLTMTGFSDPATKPNPSSGSRLSSTCRGSGTSSGS